MGAEARLIELGIELPPVFAPVGSYPGCKRSGDRLYVGGHGPVTPQGTILGKVGASVSLEQARQAARPTALSMLATVSAELGSLDRAREVIKVFGMVHCAPGFNRTPQAIDGCSDVLVDIFGDAGRHTRSAVGMAELPFETFALTLVGASCYLARVQASYALLLTLLLALAGAPSADADVFFGDLHAHSALSLDATGDVDSFFTTARDVAHLDFVVLSDHNIFLTEEEWLILKATAAAYNDEGTFVAFSGYEWTNRWHMNVYFQGDGENVCLLCIPPSDFFTAYAAKVLAGTAGAHLNHPQDIYRIDWEQIDDDVLRNIEVWNSASDGSHEIGAGGTLWALQAGFRFGLVGVSDDHHTDEPPILIGTGLTGCRVDALTRDDLLLALRDRRCYATNGTRIILDFDVDGTVMGGERSAPLDSTVTANVSVVGTETPSLIEVVRNGRVVATHTDCTGIACTFSAPVPVPDLRNFVYVRVHQPNGALAWSSPVWVSGTCDNAKACRRRIVPGGADKKTDCLTQWTVERPRGRKRRATTRLTCVDGAACDAGTTEGECTFRVGLCSGVDDGRTKQCTASAIDEYELLEPAASSESSADAQNRRTILAAVHARGSAPDPGTCSPLFEIRVPVGSSTKGPIPGRSKLASTARAAAGEDADTLTLVCKPS